MNDAEEEISGDEGVAMVIASACSDDGADPNAGFAGLRSFGNGSRAMPRPRRGTAAARSAPPCTDPATARPGVRPTVSEIDLTLHAAIARLLLAAGAPIPKRTGGAGGAGAGRALMEFGLDRAELQE